MCWRYMDAYRKGLSPEQSAYAVKTYKRHRSLPLTISNELMSLSGDKE